MYGKHCYHCKKGTFSRGLPETRWEPGTPDEIWCDFQEDEKNEDVFSKYDYKELPDHCGCFEPKIVERCGECGKEMNTPEYEVKHWVEDTPVCSKECPDKGYKTELESWRIE